MTLVNADTGEVVEIADEAEAQRLINRVTVTVTKANMATGDMIDAIAEALHRRAWIASGHGSWDDLVAAEGWEFNPRTSVERAALAKVFRDSGMSFRAIGKLVGASAQTAMRDTAGVPSGTPATRAPRTEDPEPTAAAPEVVTGTDGKTYPARRPEPMPAPPVEDAPAADLLSYRLSFTKTMAKAHEICSFDAERVAESADIDAHGQAFVWENAGRLRESLNRWFDQLEAARPSGLRVVNGGKP